MRDEQIKLDAVRIISQVDVERIDAVFIDRDGTIGGNGHFVHPDDFELYPFTLEALELLKGRGIKILAFTNQHRISLGLATIKQFEEQFKEYGFDGAYICPHSADSSCNCHKPSPGLLHKAAEDHNLDLKYCIVIGDVGSTDMLAASTVGAKKILVKTGWGDQSLGKHRDKWAEIHPDYTANDLLDAVHWIINGPGE